MLMKHCSILLLKENPKEVNVAPESLRPGNQLLDKDGITSPPVPSDDTTTAGTDPYREALVGSQGHGQGQVEGDGGVDLAQVQLDYLAPMMTFFPEDSLLSRSICRGDRPLSVDICLELESAVVVKVDQGEEGSLPPRQPEQATTTTTRRVWAFAVTSQNAVHAVELALQKQEDPAIRAAWLEIPIFCLTGATLTKVRALGFKTVNGRTTSQATCFDHGHPDQEPPGLVFENAAQLAQHLVSTPWPSSASNASSTLPSQPTAPPPPELWFLTGETRMQTLADQLATHGKPFREVVVYKTGPRPGFHQALDQWLQDQLSPLLSSPRPKCRLAWLVGFSPRGVDLAMPVFQSFLAQSTAKTPTEPSHETPLLASSPAKQALLQIQWAAIGPTTAQRIQHHLATLAQDPAFQESQAQGLNHVLWSAQVATSKSPAPKALAEALTLATATLK